MTNKQKLLSPLNLYRLGIDNAYGLVKSTLDVAAKAASGLDPMTLQALAYLRECNNQLEANLKVSVSPEWTRQLRVLGQECQQAFAAVRRTVRYYLQDGNTEEQEAARVLSLFLTPYRTLPQAALNTRAMLLQELMSKYQSSEVLLEAAEAIGIYDRMDSLQAINDSLVVTYRGRNEAMAKRHGSGTNSQLCRQALQAYGRFCLILEQAYLYTGSQPTRELILEINGFRDKYKAIVTRRSNKAVEVVQVPVSTMVVPERIYEQALPTTTEVMAPKVASASVEPTAYTLTMEAAEDNNEVATQGVSALISNHNAPTGDTLAIPNRDVAQAGVQKRAAKYERTRLQKWAKSGAAERMYNAYARI